MDKIYLLSHMYEHGENNENEEIKILGTYSSEENALKAIERYYKLKGFSNYPKESFFVEAYTINEDSNWTEGFVNTADLNRDFEYLTSCFNVWLDNHKSVPEAWEDETYYNALCDVNSVMYQLLSINELAEHIRQIWIDRFGDDSRELEAYLEIAISIKTGLANFKLVGCK